MIILALANFTFYIYIKGKIDKIIAKIINRRFDLLVAPNHDYVIEQGEIRILKEQLINNRFSFSVLDKNFYLSPNLVNKIIIEPLCGNRILDYKAEIKNGNMNIRFKNFDPAKDEGIRWKAMYLKQEQDNDIYAE